MCFRYATILSQIAIEAKSIRNNLELASARQPPLEVRFRAGSSAWHQNPALIQNAAALPGRPQGRMRLQDEQETTMSIMSTIGRYGAAIQKARRASQSERMLNRLPPEIQKDIGWPVLERRNQVISIHMFPDR